MGSEWVKQNLHTESMDEFKETCPTNTWLQDFTLREMTWLTDSQIHHHTTFNDSSVSNIFPNVTLQTSGGISLSLSLSRGAGKYVTLSQGESKLGWSLTSEMNQVKPRIRCQRENFTRHSSECIIINTRSVTLLRTYSHHNPTLDLMWIPDITHANQVQEAVTDHTRDPCSTIVYPVPTKARSLATTNFKLQTFEKRQSLSQGNCINNTRDEQHDL